MFQILLSQHVNAGLRRLSESDETYCQRHGHPGRCKFLANRVLHRHAKACTTRRRLPAALALGSSVHQTLLLHQSAEAGVSVGRRGGFSRPTVLALARQLYMPDPNQWISFLRKNGTTLPWGEVGHQQPLTRRQKSGSYYSDPADLAQPVIVLQDWVWMTPVASQQVPSFSVASGATLNSVDALETSHQQHCWQSSQAPLAIAMTAVLKCLRSLR